VEARLVELVSVTVPVPSSVVSVSDVVEEPPPPLSLLQPINTNTDSIRNEYEKRFETLPFLTLLDLNINAPILYSFKGFFNGLFIINGCVSSFKLVNYTR
jgi:hypothetical protein